MYKYVKYKKNICSHYIAKFAILTHLDERKQKKILNSLYKYLSCINLRVNKIRVKESGDVLLALQVTAIAIG